MKREKITVSEAARLMGKKTTERKKVTSRENGKKGGAPLKPLSAIYCNCEKEASLAPTDHKSGCLRRAAILRRLQKNKPLE